MIIKQHHNGQWTAVASFQGKRFLAEGSTRSGARQLVTNMLREALRNV